MQNKVDILFTGYSYTDPCDENGFRANGTSTLIRTHTGRNIIVDTLTAWDGNRLREALEGYGLHPDDINVVVCTHGHSDHIGCNYLFQHAEYHVIGASISHHDKYLDWGSEPDCKPFQLDDKDVTVHRTPGHTNACVSVVVQNAKVGQYEDQLVGICGDLFERVEDVQNADVWLEALSENPQEQRKQRLRLAEMCDYLIPGHGGGFAVTEEMILKLKKDLWDMKSFEELKE